MTQKPGRTIVYEVVPTRGPKFTRSGLDQLMKLVRQHSVKAVVCYKLDRLGRSLQHLVQIVAELDSHGVALVCPSQGIDTGDKNPAGRLTARILICMAEFQLSLIREATLSGLKSVRPRGTATAVPLVLGFRANAPNSFDLSVSWKPFAQLIGSAETGTSTHEAAQLE
jgi:DNA invertase Pin-like site-specific DNA recombinase